MEQGEGLGMMHFTCGCGFECEGFTKRAEHMKKCGGMPVTRTERIVEAVSKKVVTPRARAGNLEDFL